MMAYWKSLCLLLCFIVVLADARVLREGIHNLLSDDEVEKVFGTSPSKVPEYDIAHLVQLNHRGEFLSHDVAHDNNKAQRNLHYGLSAFGKRYHLNLKLNTDQLLAPGFVTEIRNNGESRYDRSVDHCHYIGHLVTAQGPRDKVALSNCDGLSGIIQSKREVLMISPLPKRLGLARPTHVIFRRSHGDVANIGRKLGIDVRPAPLTSKNLGQPSDDDERDSADVTSRKYYIESMVVTDTTMLTYHGNVKLLKNYVLTLMNIVQSLIGDPSIGVDMKYVLNRLEILETDEPDLVINSHAEKTLSRFCKWSAKKNASLQDNKGHFDHAALISRKPFCANSYDPKSSSCNTLLGLADLKGMCGYDTSCVLSTDSGLGTAFTIAHETGHNLGAEHDGDGNVCPDAVNLMARKASGKPTGYQWSSCSRDYITRFLSESRSSCLLDAPGQSVPIPTSLPGQEYTLNDQCKLMVKGSSGFCNTTKNLKSVCSTLWCVKGNNCHTINEPAAEGSQCAYKKLCHQGRCVHISSFGKNGPKPVDGGFSSWSSWGSCTHTCGGGVRFRIRRCDNPKPKNYGKPCRGKSKEFKYCVTKKCPSDIPDPRMKACKSKRKILFTGGKTYLWVYNAKEKVNANDRCQLICVAPLRYANQYTFSKFGAVENGLKCNGKGPKGVCINGVCQILGCDNVIGSKAKLDNCGVCKGDGSSCSLNTVSKIFDKVPDNAHDSPDYQTITVIPAGAKDIEIKELSNSKNNLAIITRSKKAILNNDFYISNSNENINAAGTTFKYSIRGRREKVTAKGPLTEAIIVQFLVDAWYKRYRVSYKYSTVSKSPSRDVSQDSTGLFKWVTTAQGCSATCGGGKRLVTVKCVRVDDGSAVSHDKCDDVPEGLSVECNMHACPPRWSIGAWGDCSKTCNDGTLGQQSRQVNCVFQSNGVEELLGDSDCNGHKPATVQACGLAACPAEWVTVKVSPCSTTCGSGIIQITSICQKTDTKGQKRKVNDAQCSSDDRPPSPLACNTHKPCQ